MRRVFPLRPSENCPLVADDGEESHGKQSKLDDQRRGSDASRILESATRLRRPSSVSISCGDENVPAASPKPASDHKPPRASAYLVFTSRDSLRSSRSATSQNKCREELSSESQRFVVSPSSPASVAQPGLAKGPALDKSNNCHESPCSVPKNCSPFDTSSRPGNLRSSSMRLLRVPDSLRSADGEVEKTFFGASDSYVLVPPCLSRSPSERSFSESSDSSSFFSKATESSSSRSLASDSFNSQKSSITERPVTANSPFRYLSARMVAEKLAKVLSKEKPRLQAIRTKSPQFSASSKQDVDGLSKEDHEPRQAKVLETIPQSSSPGCRFSDARETTGSFHSSHSLNERSVSSGDDQPVVVNDNRKGSYLPNAAAIDSESDSGSSQSLDARAFAREELAAMLDREMNQWEDKFIGAGRHGRVSLVEYSTEIANQNFSVLRHEINKLRREKRDLALEVAAEIRSRISEQKAAADIVSRMKLEMECQVEREKASANESLERELERREEEWAAKLDKLKIEEKRTRDRVIEMEEDRAELQKTIASFKFKEASWRAQAKEAEFSLCMLKQRAHGSEAEVEDLKQSFADICKKLKTANNELDTLAQRNKSLDMENSELQKEFLGLRRLCNDQEMTIEGLWQELDELVNGSSECRSESIVRLQRELLRLAGVEQVLRNEMNALHAEANTLKQERTLAYEGTPAGSVEHHQKLQGQIDGLLAQIVTLQDENQQLSTGLRTAVRAKRDAETTLRIFQSYCDGIEQTEVGSLHLEDGEEENALEGNEETDKIELQIQAVTKEKLLWKVLSGKLLLRDVELKQLDADIVALTDSRDSLQIEVDDLHAKLVMANQRVRELERQLSKKEEEVEVLQAALQDHRKELSDLQTEVRGVRSQRDEIRKEAEDMSREALRLTLELTDLRKVAEKLDEDLMLKEGQISILRGTYGDDNLN